MNKRWVALLLVAVMLVSLSACMKKENNKADVSINANSLMQYSSTESSLGSILLPGPSFTPNFSHSTTTVTDPFLLVNYHKALKVEEYYQFKQLSSAGKELYRRIDIAVNAYKREVDGTGFALTEEEKTEIMKCYLADNPHRFFLSSNFTFGRNGNICLKYSDGTNTSDSGFQAPQEGTMNSRRETFNNAVKNIIVTINHKASDYEKELAIYDYLIKNTSLDEEALKNPVVYGTTDPAYDAYGVIVEKKGVSQGYAKAFQYLCYMVGINANIVIGYDCMWNTVEIEGEWYQADAFLDDPTDSQGNSANLGHDFFNLTSDKMYKVHRKHTSEIYDYLRIPSCTSTEHAYK